MIEPVIFEFQIDGDSNQLPFWPLTQECNEFIYVIRKAELLEGADVVLWRVNRNCDVEKRIYATGYIIPYRPIGYVALGEKVDESESRWDRIARAVEASRPERTIESIREDIQEVATTWDPLIDRKVSVSREEFNTVHDLAHQIKEGNGNLLGVRDLVRVIAVRGGERIDWCTWEGNADPENLWNNVHDILRIGGILELEARQLN